MGWLWAIVLGLVLGVLARGILPGRQNIPLWLTVICGMLGAVGGNALARAVGVETTSGIDWWRHAFQLAGAIVVVALVAPLWARMRGGTRHRERA
ncbi:MULTISPECIES: GlsB/YeaQ/YmgE family stress response membrane protein [Streptomyces]|uniref:GlsB/YeaQ/YmgE family stress response membrane protein n=2 Tax=Streptomyces TaxID=1883 RepID=A0A3R7IYS0_9ACTN|nr:MULTISPECIES: GlsB/YeaQ/YmgE family stress response membrane protein [Streptomyces]MZE78761.1 GlsB/YeaQ/YmgE family stress response membrane protein [Streptomyces sp. SID5475]KNE80577.1 signal peptidase [Streptomyces fradiae]OFA41608.1 signal peptidase [Streptomyces fradiae]PQM25328.1 GlsB/YeaQ/YmgE family stress response membrane protein [Streptomyces xinghaiensis]RKM99382.1 GlsB/YeaQ/YmgE family stress response membrane protein [Streptomyces xinghaiensis]